LPYFLPNPSLCLLSGRSVQKTSNFAKRTQVGRLTSPALSGQGNQSPSQSVAVNYLGLLFSQPREPRGQTILLHVLESLEFLRQDYE
jgi:hypothetical protein